MMVQTATLMVHVFLAIGIIGLVLLQRGKGADAGTAFGAGASGTVFGARGAANFLSRTTAVFAALFFVTSLGLAWIGSQTSEPTSLLDQNQAVEESVDDAASTDGVNDGELPELPAADPLTSDQGAADQDADDLPAIDPVTDDVASGDEEPETGGE